MVAGDGRVPGAVGVPHVAEQAAVAAVRPPPRQRPVERARRPAVGHEERGAAARRLGLEDGDHALRLGRVRLEVAPAVVEGRARVPVDGRHAGAEVREGRRRAQRGRLRRGRVRRGRGRARRGMQVGLGDGDALAAGRGAAPGAVRAGHGPAPVPRLAHRLRQSRLHDDAFYARRRRRGRRGLDAAQQRRARDVANRREAQPLRVRGGGGAHGPRLEVARRRQRAVPGPRGRRLPVLAALVPRVVLALAVARDEDGAARRLHREAAHLLWQGLSEPLM